MQVLQQVDGAYCGMASPNGFSKEAQGGLIGAFLNSEGFSSPFINRIEFGGELGRSLARKSSVLAHLVKGLSFPINDLSRWMIAEVPRVAVLDRARHAVAGQEVLRPTWWWRKS